MKKIVLSAACALTLFAAACSSSPEKQAEKIMDKYISEMEQSTSTVDLVVINARFEKEMRQLCDEYPELLNSDSQILMDKVIKINSTFDKKHEEFLYSED